MSGWLPRWLVPDRGLLSRSRSSIVSVRPMLVVLLARSSIVLVRPMLVLAIPLSVKPAVVPVTLLSTDGSTPNPAGAL